MADYNFINGVSGTDAAPKKGNFVQRLAGTYQRAGQISQERTVANNDLIRATELQRLEATRWAMKEKAFDMSLKIQEKQAMAEIGEALAAGSFDDPETLSTVLGVAAKYGLSPDVVKPYLDRFDSAQDYRNRLSLLNKEYELRAGLPNSPERVRIMEQVWSMRGQAESARKSGDTEAYQNLRQKADELEGTVKSYGTSISTGFDDQGRQVFDLTTGGPGGGLRAPTVGMQTKGQATMIKFANATQLINDLTKNLKPEDVGVAGVAGEWVVDRTLEQFVPGSMNKERVANRNVLGWLRESLMREVSDEQRFSNEDRKQITRLLPSSGVWESHARAIESMSKVREIITDRSRVYAERMGEPIPEFAMKVEEIAARYQKQLGAIKQDLADGRITPEQADKEAQSAYQRNAEALRRYH